ncbi:ORF220 [White spot syndrome virus]|uniref:Wsv168 n=3 Tax=White spot syndrome virus TaxID=342409 RepID=Q8VB31_WSSVS|nr:wsv168 [Shrimp white spot syndrome virus]AAQ10673.1 wsv168 [White spot syndrome virus]AAL33172.1 wsv168 [Shrimp white spot syndrome virus]AAL89092.1 WSSV224 [Shrimp white spot syndrome virus]AFX59546.1 wsv168 [White spot syndrome virus]ATU84013.1 ORF220 [White spot syndrome virus]
MSSISLGWSHTLGSKHWVQIREHLLSPVSPSTILKSLTGGLNLLSTTVNFESLSSAKSLSILHISMNSA